MGHFNEEDQFENNTTVRSGSYMLLPTNPPGYIRQ